MDHHPLCNGGLRSGWAIPGMAREAGRIWPSGLFRLDSRPESAGGVIAVGGVTTQAEFTTALHGVGPRLLAGAGIMTALGHFFLVRMALNAESVGTFRTKQVL